MSSKNWLSFEDEIKVVFDEFDKQDIQYLDNKHHKSLRVFRGDISDLL